MADVFDATNPFGNPDGSRAHLEQITKSFINFRDASAWGGLSTPPDDLSARVLVGRKGSGKTLYLRRLQAHASEEASLYAGPLQQDNLSTSKVISFCQWFSQTDVNERWKALWRRAILRSVISHLMYSPKISRPASHALRDRLTADFPGTFRQFKAAVSVYSEAAAILHECGNGGALERYLDRPEWNDIESVIAEVLNEFPPLCFYMDSVDEEFESAPMYWLQCQKGLFYECMDMLRHPGFGNRLHIHICVRDVVYSAVLNTEHKARFINEPHIRVLNWNKNSIRYFLEEKINKLPSSFMVQTSRLKSPVHSWLGLSHITNLQRNVTEPIEQYLLRHTRQLPRDIVILGNILCKQISMSKTFKGERDHETVIRESVREAASIFGDEQLTICANEYVSSCMPKYAAKHRYDDTYTANSAYASGIVDQFRSLIDSVGKDRFSKVELERAKSSNPQLFENEGNPWSILWRNGLLGYMDGRNNELHVFHSDDRINRFSLPSTAQTYVFHPILIDSVGISSVGEAPVLPW